MRNLAGNFNTLVQDLSCGTRVDTNDRTADRGLSGTGLAYEGEGFSPVDVKEAFFTALTASSPLPKVISTFFTCSKISTSIFVNRTMLRQMRNSGLAFLLCRHFQTLL